MGKVILIVEDDPKSLTLTSDLLQIYGYTTIEATDGEQGVELAKVKTPDLILMDIMMPKMDGFAACHASRADEATKNIPVLMLTAINEVTTLRDALNIGADDYITKPFKPKELIARVKAKLRRAETAS